MFICLVSFCYSMHRSICRSFGSHEKNPFQASGGISTLRSRISGLQSTAQGIPSGAKRLLRVKKNNKAYMK